MLIFIYIYIYVSQNTYWKLKEKFLAKIIIFTEV